MATVTSDTVTQDHEPCDFFIITLYNRIPSQSSCGHAESSIDILIQGPDVITHSTAFLPPLTDLLSTLASLQRKPTCYRTAATSLIYHCKSLSSDIPDPDRVQFAIKLTICELDLIAQTPSTCRVETRWNECVENIGD